MSCVICTLPRSGSWLLAEALAATGIAGRPEEYLREDWQWQYVWQGGLEQAHQIDYWPPARRMGRSCPPETIDVAGFVDAIRRIATTDNGILGVKVHLSQLEDLVGRAAPGRGGSVLRPDEATLRTWFPNPRYVLLTRRNRLRQAISHYRAIATDRWWAAPPVAPEEGAAAITPSGRPPPPAIPPEDVDLAQVEQFRMMFVQQDQRWRELFQLAGVTPLEVAYEDLAADPAGTLATVLRFLGHDAPAPEAVGSRLRRQADAATERTVTRYRAWRAQAIPPRWTPDGPPPVGLESRSSVVIVDNFYADPGAVREYALRQEYYYPYESDEAVRSGGQRPTWMASRHKPAEECPFKSSSTLIRRLEEVTGEAVDLEHWRADFPVDATGRPEPDFRSAVRRGCLWNCAFHSKPDNAQAVGAGVHNHVVDTWNSVDIHGWAGLVYLSPDAPLDGGLRLWRNRRPDRQFDWMSEAEAWEQIDMIGNVPNRLILCRGNLPHSGARGWGSALASGRLFQTFFFRTRGPVLRAGVEVTL